MSLVLCVLYFAVLAVLSAYGLHRFHLVMLVRRHRERIADVAPPRDDDGQPLAPLANDALPVVTIQLPIFNESTVIERLLETVSEMDYPRDKLQLQVLDDSTDETRSIAAAKVRELRVRGFDAEYVHRVDRTGYKAGALDNGLASAKGDLIAVFDADFLPRPDFARALVEHFRDPGVGMVQARWAHLNRDASLLTQVQALMLDGHHMVENRARYGAGFLFNFSGTGGMWRRQAIIDAGGWQHDTLTEDLDLSYRAQLAGWRFVYRPDVVSPAELPEDISALRAQQYRWAKGTVQTARKLLRRILKADLTVAQRIEAFFHLTPHFAYPLMLALCLLLLPVLATVNMTSWQTALVFDLPLCMAPISSLAAFYMLAETSQGRSAWSALRTLPVLIGLGAGLAPHLAVAVADGLKNRAGEFVRTPKRGSNRWRYRASMDLPLVEVFFAVVCGACVVMSIRTGHWFATPFASLFTFGFTYVAWLLGIEALRRRRRDLAPEAEEIPVSGTRAKGEAPALTDVAA